MPAEIIDKLYEIAQKGGYAGDQPARWEGGIAAITSAISNESPVLRDTVVDALDDLKTVAFEGGGGGGGDLGALMEVIIMLDAEPVVDSALSFSNEVFSNLMVGDSVAAVADSGFNGIAGGVKAYDWLYSGDETANITVAAWAITFEESGQDYVCKSRRALTADCDVVYGDPLSQGESATWTYLVIPDPSTLGDGEFFAFSIVNSNN